MSDSQQHTPGPWLAKGFLVNGADGRPIVDTVLYRNEVVGVVNAHLIAAAPDLLDALEECVTHIRNHSGFAPCLTSAREAISKARGGQT